MVVAIMVWGFSLTAVSQLPAAPGIAAAPAATAPAEAPPAAARIAVIAFQAAVGNTNEGRRDYADLQKKYIPKDAALKARGEEIDNLAKQLQEQGAGLSEVERSTRAKEIDDKKKRLDRETEDLRNDGQQEMQDMFSALATKVYDVMQSYAEQQGITLVLDVSQQQSPVLYAADGTNISQQVVDAYNLKSGVPAPPIEPAAEAPRPRPATPATRPATPATKAPTQH